MPEDEEIQSISLDTEARVRGICQLMDGIIFDIYVVDMTSEDDFLLMLMQFDEALDMLSIFHLRARRFLKRAEKLNKIEREEACRYRAIVKQKREQISDILVNEYKQLGF